MEKFCSPLISELICVVDTFKNKKNNNAEENTLEKVPTQALNVYNTLVKLLNDVYSTRYYSTNNVIKLLISSIWVLFKRSSNI